MCCQITKTKAIILNIAPTIVFGALTTGAIIGAIAAGTTLAIIALSVGAVVAGIFTLMFLSNVTICCIINYKCFNEHNVSWPAAPILTLKILNRLRFWRYDQTFEKNTIFLRNVL